MRLNGCLMQLSTLVFVAFITLFGSLVLLGPAIGNVYDNVLEDFDDPGAAPTIAIITLAPSLTNIPSATPTDTDTHTPEPSATPIPTNTHTPEPSATPIPTNTDTPVPTDTATATSTFTPVPTDTAIPTSTFTPSPSPTPVLCEIENNRDVRVNVRAAADSASTIITQIDPAVSVEVIGRAVDGNNFVWYEIFLPLDDKIYTIIEANVEGDFIRGWIREDVVTIVGDGDCGA